MRIRTAKKLAERIDLNYFKRAHGLRRWRFLLSTAVPVVAILWIAAYAAAGSRTPFSAGPVSSAHAFAETKCEVCHASAGAAVSFRSHVSEKACLTCHDAPAHADTQTSPPDCASCHVEHRGRVQLAKVDDGTCVDCHADLKAAHGTPRVATQVGRFPADHPEFAAAREAAADPGTIKFNHAVHLKKDGVRSLVGTEVLQCGACHTPEGGRDGATSAMSGSANPASRAPNRGLMSVPDYEQHCARCHGLEFDYRIAQPAPHDEPDVVRAAVRQAFAGYIAAHPEDVSKADEPRRLPLNFPGSPEPPARSAAEWVGRRAAAAERLLWSRCDVCHARAGTGTLTVTQAQQVANSRITVSVPVPAYAPANLTKRWMTRAAFDHTPHLMVRCQDCHAAETSRATADVLMPARAACATCHAPTTGAEARCFECHRYHQWAKAHAVAPAFNLTDFK